MKRLFFLLVVIVIVSAISLIGVGCKEEVAEEVEESVTEKEEIKVAFCSPAMDIEWFMWMADGARAKAEELGVEVIITDANYDNDKMISDFRDVIAMGAQAASTILMDDAIGPAVKEICDDTLGLIIITVVRLQEIGQQII